MKRLLTFGASALALSLAATGAAQAQSTIAAEIGPNLIDLIDDEFQAGVGLNMALNTARIDGSVTVLQENFATDLSVEASAAGELEIGLPTGIAGAVAVEVSLGEEITEVNLGEIATLAVGAINDGTVKFGRAGSSSEGSFAVGVSGNDIEVGDDITSSAASTSNTAAAYYDADFYASIGGFDASLSESFKEAAYGPAQDFFAMNVAFNNTDLIDGSVDIVGNGMSATGIGTTVAGAINTGVIESGL